MFNMSRLACLAAGVLVSASANVDAFDTNPVEVESAKPKRALPVPDVKYIQDVKPGRAIFRSASIKKPVEIRSAKEAARHFNKVEAAKLARKVDFEKQVVLVFAWRGSGKDQLSHTLLKSNPPQIQFNYIRGRTRDLRPHISIVAVRSGLKWHAP